MQIQQEFHFLLQVQIKWEPVKIQLVLIGFLSWKFSVQLVMSVPCKFNWYQLKRYCSVIQRILTGLLLKVNYHQLKSTGTCYNQLVPVESHLVPVENAIQLVTCSEIRENSNWSPVRSQLTPVEIKLEPDTINWFPLKVNWFQLKMPFNWYQLKNNLRSGRFLTGLLLEVYYHQLKSTGTCYNQLVPVESQLVPVEIQLVPVENSNWSNRNFLLGISRKRGRNSIFRPN